MKTKLYLHAYKTNTNFRFLFSFWETLLLDTLPLLESDEPVFSSNDTYEIMLCLELKSSSLDGEKADLLRLALARNLARTALSEGDDPGEE